MANPPSPQEVAERLAFDAKLLASLDAPMRYDVRRNDWRTYSDVAVDLAALLTLFARLSASQSRAERLEGALREIRDAKAYGNDKEGLADLIADNRHTAHTALEEAERVKKSEKNEHVSETCKETDRALLPGGEG